MDTLDNLKVGVGDRVTFHSPENGMKYQYEVLEVKLDFEGELQYIANRLDGKYISEQTLSKTRPYWTVELRATINKKPQPTFEVIFEDGSTARFTKRIIAFVEYEATEHPMPKTKKVKFFNEKGENS